MNVFSSYGIGKNADSFATSLKQWYHLHYKLNNQHCSIFEGLQLEFFSSKWTSSTQPFQTFLLVIHWSRKHELSSQNQHLEIIMFAFCVKIIFMKVMFDKGWACLDENCKFKQRQCFIKCDDIIFCKTC